MSIEGVLHAVPAVKPAAASIRTQTTKTIDHRPDETLRFFINHINTRLLEGRFTQIITESETEYHIEMLPEHCQSTNTWYSLTQTINGETNQQLKSVIQQHFKDSGWKYCFVDPHASGSYKIEYLIKLIPQ